MFNKAGAGYTHHIILIDMGQILAKGIPARMELRGWNVKKFWPRNAKGVPARAVPGHESNQSIKISVPKPCAPRSFSDPAGRFSVSK